MDEGKQSRIESLTGLRYLAALSVLLAHIEGYLPADWVLLKQYLGRSSGLGMPLFFVLSGFLMTYNYGDAFSSRAPGTLWKFFVARFSRIYPVYLVGLLFSISFPGTFFWELLNRPDDTLSCWPFLLTLTQSWVHLSVFQGTDQARTITLSYNAVSWSVSTEAFFYALFPLIALTILPRIKTAKGAIAAAINTVAIWVVGNILATQIICPNGVSFEDYHFSGREWFFYLSPYARLGEFLVGCFVGRLYQLRSGIAVGRLEGMIAHAVMGSTIVLLLWTTYLSNFLSYIPQNIGMAPLCAALIYCLARYSSFLQKGFATPFMILLGESSYSLYLVHILVLQLVWSNVVIGGGVGQWWVIGYQMAAAVALLHILCFGLLHFIERPARNWLRGGLCPRRSAAVLRAGVLPVSGMPRAAA
jgi:peptidoglycan/LPS O-acetylase OafA/YrhL